VSLPTAWRAAGDRERFEQLLEQALAVTRRRIRANVSRTRSRSAGASRLIAGDWFTDERE
jgi:hypothetical protein